MSEQPKKDGLLSPEERDEAVRGLWSKSAEAYGSLAAQLPSYLESNRALVEAIDLQPGHRVLDLACGGGATLAAAFLAQPDLGEAWAVDWVAEMTDQVPKLFPDRTIHTGVAPAQTYAHLLGEGKVDRVLCNGAFFQFEAPGSVLEETARALAPGGKLGFTLPGPSNTLRFIELFHRLGLTKPLEGGPQGPGSALADRCTVRNVDQIVQEAGWELETKVWVTVETSKEDYVRWLSLPVFRRPEWVDWTAEELTSRLLKALEQTDEVPTARWLVVVAHPAT